MLVDECGASAAGGVHQVGGNGNGNGGVWSGGSIRGGWTTPVHQMGNGCRANSSMSFGGSVPSLHHTGSMRSLRSHHSVNQVHTYAQMNRTNYTIMKHDSRLYCLMSIVNTPYCHTDTLTSMFIHNTLKGAFIYNLQCLRNTYEDLGDFEHLLVHTCIR
ncbi:hypothetical protein QAD02_015223 [Eretmocerus hayati]|uniref:Uncharacterized protein n=1 Tax=Eretmocerus hayati TaxID=131215 RepID=A0ACC2P9A2_9HYME|nr:hypothetical protein QAD02_015223 [Eretmocerus hayati]